MGHKRTDQEIFWAGEFGDNYTDRNAGPPLFKSNVAFFSRIFQKTGTLDHIIEFGANRGLNLLAIQRLLPDVKLTAVEINAKAVVELKKIQNIDVHEMSLFDFSLQKTWDLAFVKGVLIHLHPEKLNEAYEILYQASHRFVCIAEYYNPTPVEVPYRGHQGFLFKRDFAGEMLDRYQDLRLVDYGFVYKRDPEYPQDDITWFLLEKTRREKS